jgi:hypothetical protein
VDPDAEAEPQRYKVEFAAFAPRTVTPNCQFILDIWAYLPEQYSSVFSIAKNLGRDLKIGQKNAVTISWGAILTINIEVPQLKIDDPVDTLVWTGEPANTSYIIEVPEDVRIGNYGGTAVIGHEGLTIAKLKFVISVSPVKSANYVDSSSETIYHKTAFASYASADREEVLSRVQGMKKIAPQLDIFIDVFSLRSGDDWEDKLAQHVPNKDTFFLFWSQHAARSLWVEREWRLALAKKGLNYIDPVPLEEPQFCPPPLELERLHFSDMYLGYIKNRRLKDEMTNQQAAKKALNFGRGRCERGHVMDPSWVSCPYCEELERHRLL